MEELLSVQSVLDAISKGLSIRYTEQKIVNTITMKVLPFIQYKSATDEVQEAFKKELQAQLEESAKKIAPSRVIYLSYYFGIIRGKSLLHYGSLVVSPSCEMAQALSKLPKLGDGESYAFPYPTSACFRLNSDNKFEVESLSQWILDNISAS